MDIQAYIDEIKFRLTGNILETELSDSDYQKVLDISLREIQRYIDSTRLITIPFSKCIDFNSITDDFGKELKINTISRVMRTEGNTGSGEGTVDPMEVSRWQLLSGTGNLCNFQNYAYNFASYNTLLQIRNTTSTDLAFYFDKYSNKLYVNVSTAAPSQITVEYVPRFDSVEEIQSDFWIDTLCRLATANAKVIVGRIRSRYTQSNALWQQDGAQILQEGTTELQELRQYLQTNTQLTYPID